jgi:hypothetical protein
MRPALFGIPYRSNAEVYNAGTTITFKPDYLNGARDMDAPEVHAINIRFTGTVGAITGGAKGRDAAKLIDTVRFRDGDVDIWNVSGAGSRVMEQLDWGAKQIDPADIASGSTNATYSYILRISFNPYRSLRARDFAVPLGSFLDSGEFAIQTAAAVPTGWAAVQADWRIQLFAEVRDGRKRELKSRRRVKEEAMTQQEFDYQVNGSLRAAVVTSKLTTTGYTDLSGFTTLNSRTLMWPSGFQSALLTEFYRREHNMFATNDEFLLAANGALPLYVPREKQKIGQMIDTKSLHVDFTAAAPTSARLITDVVIDRDANAGARQMGYEGPGPLGAAVNAKGQIKGVRDNYRTNGFNGHLARRMPITIPGNQKI